VAICEPQPEDSASVTIAAHRLVAAGEAGELRVKGPGVFKEYVWTTVSECDWRYVCMHPVRLAVGGFDGRAVRA
jgi:hypothetical protein